MTRLTKKHVLAELKKHGAQIRAFGVKELELFGSHAASGQEKSSDLDFLVEFEAGRGGYDDYMGLLIFLQDLFDREIDLVKKRLLRKELRPYVMEAPRYAAEL